jgi:KDO2-lipid IV(A) lauroyltransferase
VKRAPLRHGLEHALFLPFQGLIRALPHAASRSLGARLGALAHAADRRRRRIADDNLRHALPELDAPARARLVAACFRHFGAAFADTLSAGRFDLPDYCRHGDVHGLEHLTAAEAAGRGVIVLSAHFGNWEAAPFYVTIAAGPLAVVGRAADNPHFDRVVRALRCRFGNQMLDKRGAVRDMFRLLRARGRVGLLIDQRVRPEEAIDVPFFGRPAWTSPIVARLALKTGAAILPLFGDHLPGGRYRIDFLPPIVPAGRDDEATTLELTRRCLAVCEAVVRRSPERWLWLHRRWKR